MVSSDDDDEDDDECVSGGRCRRKGGGGAVDDRLSWGVGVLASVSRSHASMLASVCEVELVRSVVVLLRQQSPRTENDRDFPRAPRRHRPVSCPLSSRQQQGKGGEGG